MADYAHKKTDKIIENMERKVAKEYKQAEKELTDKINDYLKKFEEKDKVKQQQLADGKITQEQYNDWKIGQIATGDRWQAMRDTLAEEITNANDIAKSIINDHSEEVYSLNHNYATYQVEKDAMIDTSYTLYNRRSTEELFKNKKSLLPAPKEGSKAWQAAHDKDLKWNQQKINSSMIQGILQGDSIPQIAKRLREVVGMNSRSAMRNARTMTTSIENKGRDDAYAELREKGIELETVWIATLDDRTRHSHRLLHGEIRNEKIGKYSNGLRYPADPMGDAEEVYNCRCSETSYVKGFPLDIPKWSPKMGDMTYEEWLGVKEDGESISFESSPQDVVQRFTVNDVGSKPERPRSSDFDDYDEYQKAREEYKAEREVWMERVDRFVNESMPSKSMSVDDMNEWCQKHNAVVYGDISKVDSKALTVVTERMEKLFDEFPLVQRRFEKYGRQFEFAFDESSDYLAEASRGFSFGKQWKDFESVLRNEIVGTDGFRVVGDGTVNQVIDHEFGHNVYSAIRDSLTEYDKNGDRTKESWDRIHGLERDLMNLTNGKSGMSEYASTNDDELFAEAFSAWHGGEKTDFAIGMENLLKKYGVIR